MKNDKTSERLSATNAKMVKLTENMPFPSNFKEEIDNNHFLLIFTKESNQVLLFPVKSKNIIKIWCQLDELNVTFQKELISDLTDYGLTDVWVAGITTALTIPRTNPSTITKFKLNEIWKMPKTIWKIGGMSWILLLIASSFWAFGTHLVETGVVDSLIERFGVSDTKASFASNILMGIYVALLIVPLLIIGNKLGKIRSSVIACVTYGVFCLLLAIMKNFNLIYFIVIIGGIGNIFISTFQIALPADIVPKERAASFLGMFFVFGSAVKPIAYIIQGFILEDQVKNTTLAIFGGYPWVFLIAAIIMLSSTFFFVFMRKKTMKDNNLKIISGSEIKEKEKGQKTFHL